MKSKWASRSRFVELWNQWVRSEPSAGLTSMLGTAALIGLVVGVLDGAHVVVRKAIRPLGQATLGQTIDVLWMAPLVHIVTMLLLALLLGLLLRAWRKPVSVRLLVILLAGLGTYGLLRSARLGIGIWPTRLLSLGIAVQAGAWMARRDGLARSKQQALFAGLAGWVLIAGLLPHGSRMVREWHTLRTLPEAAAGSPNVLLLILDTVRAQSLSLYGHEHATTPALEALARESTVFDRAVSVSSWTLTSHAAMLTGYYPGDLSVGPGTPLDDARATLAEVLAAQGYATAGFVANGTYAGRAAGMARGFSHFRDSPAWLRMVARSTWLTNRMHAATLGRRTRRQTQMSARQVSEEFLQWSERQERPFFAMLNFMDAHSPYDAPDSLVARFAAGRSSNWLDKGRTQPADVLEGWRGSYDAAIAYIDQEIGRIVETLRERGQLDRTIVIVTADHGEQLGEHDPGLIAHANSLYGAVIKVPLLIRYPAAVPADERSASTVSTRRIPATVMRLLGSGTTSPFPGRPLLRGDDLTDDAAADRTPAFSFLRPLPATTPREPLAAGPMASVLWGPWHYIRNGSGEEELYDVIGDPWELENRITDPALAPVLAWLRSSLAEVQPVRVAQAGTAANRFSSGPPDTAGISR